MPSTESPDRFARLYLKRPEKKPKRVLRFALLAAAMVALAFGLIALGPPQPMGIERQGGTIAPADDAKTEQEIKAELGESVREGMMNVSMASNVAVDADMNARIDAVNIAQNRLDQKITLMAADGTELFTSPMLPPGSGIETVHLDGSIPEGRSPATAVFTGYDPATGAAAGSIALEITLEKEGTHDE